MIFQPGVGGSGGIIFGDCGNALLSEIGDEKVETVSKARQVLVSSCTGDPKNIDLNIIDSGSQSYVSGLNGWVQLSADGTKIIMRSMYEENIRICYATVL